MPDLRRHRSFGPLPERPQHAQHTDACIRDAARWGFCDHTRLQATTAQLNRATRTTRHRRIRAALSYLGLLLVALPTIYLSNQIGLNTLWLIPLFSGGWLLVFTCGIPRAFTDTPDDILPPQAAARLRDEIT